MGFRGKTGVLYIAWSSFRDTLSKPVYWVGIFVLPLFMFLFMGTLMREGLPERTPAAVVDMDQSRLSREMTRNLDAMQMADITETVESFTQARQLMQEGKVYGIFLIPRNFQRDLLSGRSPEVTYYTNMTYYVPASLLFKTFKINATYAKVDVLADAGRNAGLDVSAMAGSINPVSVVMHPIGNPWMNYAYYLGVSFIPAVLHLMIILMTCFTLGECVKYGRTRRLMRAGRGSVLRVVTGLLMPQTLIWIVMALFMQTWMYCFNNYPMHGSWGWITLSNVMFVLATQGFGLLLFCALPNLRLSLSAGALTGILTFSIAAFSFPYESMYPAIGIFSWIVPMRYNLLIAIDQALNGIDIYYSRMWYVAYIIFMVAPLPLLWRIKRAFQKPVYVP